jgi:hypothetical protein
LKKDESKKMKSQNQFCLIGQTNCGRKPGNPVCPWCGIDERVVYPGKDDLEVALAEANAKYHRRPETPFRNQSRGAEGVNSPMNVVIDIGATGVRLGLAAQSGVQRVSREKVESATQLVAAIYRLTNGATPDALALAVPGILNGKQLKLSQNAGWLTGDIPSLLSSAGLDMAHDAIMIVNDGEAHVMALRCHPDVRYGAINFACGTGVAFGVLDFNGNLLRSLSNDNWEIGDFQLHTKAREDALWYALGSHGFNELIQSRGVNDGAKHYGWRLGRAAAQMTLLFRPQTIGLSGSVITHNWSRIQAGFHEEFACLKEFEKITPTPRVIVLDEHSALTGLSALLEASGLRQLRR